MSRGIEDLCLPSFKVGTSIRVLPSWPHHLMEVTVLAVENDFFKATQLGSRIAIVSLEPSEGRGWSTCGMLTSPGCPAGKAGEGPYRLLTIFSASVLPGQRQGLPQGERLTHGVGGANGENSPPEKDCKWAGAHVLGH